MTDRLISDDETGRKGSCATCSTCRFGRNHRDHQDRIVMVACRRYPEARTVNPLYWCGEYRSSEPILPDVTLRLIDGALQLGLIEGARAILAELTADSARG